MYALTDGVFDAVDMFTDLFSRKDKNNKNTDNTFQ